MTGTQFKFEGYTYMRTDKDYCYKIVKSRDAHGNITTDKKRISKEAFDEIFERYLANSTEETHEDMMQEVFDGAYEHRKSMVENEKQKAEESDKQAEDAVNGKAKKRTSRAKAAFTMTENGLEISLTAKQVDFMKHLPDTEFWENGVDSSIWVDVLCEDIGGQFEGKPMTVGAMISTLREKNLVMINKQRVDGHVAKSMELTELGKKVAKKLGL